MSRSERRSARFHPGLNVQLLLYTIFPLAILLIIFAFGSVFVHQREMRRMVGKGDEVMVRAVASALGAAIDYRIAEVRSLALRAALVEDPRSVLSRYSDLTSIFDAGAAIFTSRGELLASSGDISFWQGSGSPIEGLAKFTEQGMVYRIIHTTGGTLVEMGAALPHENLVAVGAFSINKLVELISMQAFPPDQAMNIFLVDGSGTLMYQKGGHARVGMMREHPGVNAGLMGRSGTTYMKTGGNEQVVSYSPVSPTGWVLVMEEPWETVVNPILNTSQIGPLVIAPLLLVTLVGLWFGARQIVQPLQQLEKKAARLAWGDFGSIEEPVEGIAEIRHLQSQMIEMAHKVKSAQKSLHDYIGAITSAQEDERRRLARELHDDTLQALIALKQRLQMAQRSIKDRSTKNSLNEVHSLTEETINNLRRYTQALRPIYLEDLGLVPALEILARDAGQTGGFPIQFQQQGDVHRLDPTVELALYRMAQELLNNLIRHAQASQGKMLITFKKKAVVLEVRDNGIGFSVPDSPTDFAAQGHFGLLGMSERAELVGAQLDILSTQGQGTHITISIQE